MFNEDKKNIGKEDTDKNKLSSESESINPFDDDFEAKILSEFQPIGATLDEKPKSADNRTKKQKLTEILNDNEEIPIVFDLDKHNDESDDEKQSEKVVLFDETLQQKTADETPLSIDRARSIIESALYVCGNEGLSLIDLKRLTNLPSNNLKKILSDWANELDKDDTRGLTIKIYGERYKLFSKADNREELSKLITIKYRNPLSAKIMETLAIIAYNQPCTKTIIQDIRGKDPTNLIDKLVDLGLVNEAGRGDGPGRPLLFTVSHKFYDIFGIKNLGDLPKINIDQPFLDEEVSFFDTNRFNE